MVTSGEMITVSPDERVSESVRVRTKQQQTSLRQKPALGKPKTQYPLTLSQFTSVLFRNHGRYVGFDATSSNTLIKPCQSAQGPSQIQLDRATDRDRDTILTITKIESAKSPSASPLFAIDGGVADPTKMICPAKQTSENTIIVLYRPHSVSARIPPRMGVT
jgi:hypothetical protein